MAHAHFRHFGDAKREGELRYKRKQITKKWCLHFRTQMLTDIIYPESFLLGRGFKQNLEMPFTATTGPRLLCADISPHTVQKKGK